MIERVNGGMLALCSDRPKAKLLPNTFIMHFVIQIYIFLKLWPNCIRNTIYKERNNFKSSISCTISMVFKSISTKFVAITVVK
jgi:hypothetical protein